MNKSDFIKNTVNTIETIEINKRLSWWNLATTGEEKYAKDLQNASIELRKIFSSEKNYQVLLTSEKQKDPLLEREASILLNHFTENQIPLDLIEEIVKLETEIESIYTNFRPVVDGRSLSNNELKEILMNSLDSKERELAWKASKEIGNLVEDKILKLIELRNRSAQLTGYTNYYTMQLELQDLDEERLFELLDKLNHSITPQWKEYKAKLDKDLSEKLGVPQEKLMPWHYQDPFFQEAPSQGISIDKYFTGKDIVEISRSFYDSIGLPVDDILARSDLFERQGKSQHAFCTSIDSKQDVRILCNIKDNEYWMGTQLHELGHAVYDKYIDQSLPFLLREPAHICTTEAIAMLFGRFSKKKAFLQTYCEINQITEDTEKQLSANLIVFARWALVMIHFERAMYQQPWADLNTLWWDCVETFQDVHREPGRFAPDWASKLHLACAPVYYQNYILGEMTASQLLHYMNQFPNQSNGLPSKESGEWLKNSLFKLGKQFLWEETLEKVTGELLNPSYFVKDIESK
ncbi:MAG: M2 family metallopeptidase [Parachlamydiaceae bacterium]|nr:M2 family metallopeptidase [Parachlamydiaceae bacterium]